MAAKKKTKKSQIKKRDEKNEILVYFYALVVITLSLVGILNIGHLGHLLAGCMFVIVGSLSKVVYALIIVFSIFWMIKKDIREIPLKYVIGVFSLLMAWIISASMPKDQSISGLALLTNFCTKENLIQVIQGNNPGGGVIGVILLSVLSFLIDYIGAKIVVIVLFVLGIILLLSGKGFVYLQETGKTCISHLNPAFKALRERMKKKEKVDSEEIIIQESDDIYTSIDVESRVKPGQASFIDIDDEFDLATDARTIYEPKEELVSKQPEQRSEEQKVIDEIIGKEDTFTSQFTENWKHYKLPRLTMLTDFGKKTKSIVNARAANENGQRLIEILDEFGVRASLIATHIGPSVTKFEVKPDLGVRVNKISNLQYDIKMALAAKDIRIEAPIPGKSAVGIEIPNVEKTMVGMKELMKNVPDKYQDKKMLFALGKDLMGNCVYGELNKMPHLLIAGATGSGKSVCVNSIITSILMRAKPDEVKLLLVDPKKVEFTPYKAIPHLLGPVITDGEQANRALKVIVNMMDKRYELFSMAGVRNIAGYNTYIEKHPEEGLQKLPWIVVIIDELADLMLVAAKEVEASIQRITQLARAAGIHLIVATQRPSVDVITGIIKANIPSRIAFAVSSAVDSRTILDQMGAEKLLGNGDMLYTPVGETNPMRVQGVFVSDEEVQKICDFVSSQGKPKYEDAFLRLEAVDQGLASSSDSADPLFEEVKRFVIQSRKASTSLIQRKFSIGYARAARLIDVLEEQKIIGPSRGSKPREVLVKYEQPTE